MMVVGGGVDYELDVVGPAKGCIGHFNLLSIFVMIGKGSVEHAETFWSS